MKKLLDNLVEKNLTIAFAESITGGHLSSEITKYPGASKAFLGSVVCYSQEVKLNLLNVKKETIKDYSVVSAKVSDEMALGLKSIINASIVVAITGNAGPTLEEDTNKLECFITVLYENKLINTNYQFKQNNRINNINEATNKVIEIVNEIIK